MFHLKKYLFTLLSVLIFSAGSLVAQDFPCGLTEEDFPEFTSEDEFITWAEEECPELLDFFGNDDDWDDYEIPDCLVAADSIEFASPEEFITYLEANCPDLVGEFGGFGNWGGGFDGPNGGGGFDGPGGNDGPGGGPDFDEDFEWDLPDCLQGIDSLDIDFEDFDALMAYVETNCPELFDPETGEFIGGGFGGSWGGGSDFDIGFGGDVPDCLLAADSLEFADHDEFIMYLEANCPELVDQFDGFGGWGGGPGNWDGYDDGGFDDWGGDNIPDCLLAADTLDFADYDEFIMYLETNCPELVDQFDGFGGWGGGPGDWGGDFDGWNEDVPDCLLAADSIDFADYDEFIMYLEANCPELVDQFDGFGGWGGGPGDWGGDFDGWNGDNDWDGGYDGDYCWDWSEQDEMDFLAEQYGECLGDMAFADLEEMYTYIFENCENDSVSYGVGWGGSDFVPACLQGIDGDFETFQEMLLFLDANCTGEIDFAIPDCLLTAPVFDNDDDFLQYISDNCEDAITGGDGEDGDDEDDGGVPNGSLDFNNDNMGALLTSYNLVGSFDENASLETAVGFGELRSTKVTLYPNPTRDIVLLEILEDFIMEVKVTDISGKTVILNSVDEVSVLELDVSVLSTGVYFVQVKTSSGAGINKPLVVE